MTWTLRWSDAEGMDVRIGVASDALTRTLTTRK